MTGSVIRKQRERDHFFDRYLTQKDFRGGKDVETQMIFHSGAHLFVNH